MRRERKKNEQRGIKWVKYKGEIDVPRMTLLNDAPDDWQARTQNVSGDKTS